MSGSQGREMRVTFVLPFAYLTGGTRMALEYATRLRAAGHATRIVFPRLPYRFRGSAGPLSGMRSWLGSLKNNLLFGGRPPGQPVLSECAMVPAIADRFLPEADAVVATAWPTAYSVVRLAPSRGAKCYLVQHREIDSGPLRQVDASYRLPLFRIAGSDYTARLLRGELGVEVDAVVANGVNIGFWSAAAEPMAERAGVLMPHLLDPRKGAADGLAALARIHERRPDVPLCCFGRRRPGDLPDFVRYVENPDDRALRRLYAEAAVFLFPSRYEGFGLPPLEAMAAGCPVVATRVGAVPDFLADGSTGRLVEPGDPAAMADAVLALLGDADRRARLAAAARPAAARFDLAHAAREFEAALALAITRQGGRPWR